MKKKPSYIHLIVFAIVSLAILFPLLDGKYILTLDTIISQSAMHGGKSISDFIYGVWVNRPNQGELGLAMSGIPLFILTIVLKSFIPTFILQKLEIFLIFFLSMLSMYLLIDTKKEVPRYFGAFLYAVNPFTYIRLLAGHWGLLLGYAILPFFVKELLKKEIKVRNAVLWLSLISILSTHMLAMAFIILLVFAKRPFNRYLWIVLLFALLNLYWLYPVFTASHTTIAAIDASDAAAFISRNQFVNILITNAMMYGFWRAKAYIIPGMYVLLPLFTVILYLVVHGALYGKAKGKNRFVIVALVALALAVGIAHPYSAGIFEFFFKIPFMKGFREPNKFVSLLALSYSFFGAYALNAMKRKVMAVFLAVPFLFTPLLFALGAQLEAIDYPADYYEVNDFLNQDKEDFNVLFLPWHLYLDFSWIRNTDKRIANPSAIFFDKPVIKGDNMEYGGIYSHSTNPVSRYVEANLDSARNLALVNVRYIIIAKEYNVSMNDTTRVKETENLILLRNNKETHRFLQSDDLEVFYELEYKRKSAISYELEPEMRYVIFTDGYDDNWRLDGQKPIEGLAVNAYLSGRKLRYVKFNYLLIAYFISLVSFIWVVWKG